MLFVMFFRSFSRLISNNKIKSIAQGVLPISLVTLELRANPLHDIHEAFKNLRKLKKL